MGRKSSAVRVCHCSSLNVIDSDKSDEIHKALRRAPGHISKTVTVFRNEGKLFPKAVIELFNLVGNSRSCSLRHAMALPPMGKIRVEWDENKKRDHVTQLLSLCTSERTRLEGSTRSLSGGWDGSRGLFSPVK